MTTVPVLDIGGTHVTGGLVDLETGAPTVADRNTVALDGSATAEEILAGLAACANRVGAGPGTVWGVAVPGPFDYASGIARFGVGKFDALAGADLRQALLDRIGPRPADVRFLNDAVAFGLGAWATGAGHRPPRILAITLGTGVGSCFLDNGIPVYDGPAVPPNGEAYRLLIDDRPLEETVSRRAIMARYAALSGDHGPDVAEIAARARAAEPAAAEALDVTFGALGEALAPWIRRFGAGAVVVGGAMTGSWDVIGPRLIAGLRRAGCTLGETDVEPAADTESAALIGAAVHVAPMPPRRVIMPTLAEYADAAPVNGCAGSGRE